MTDEIQRLRWLLKAVMASGTTCVEGITWQRGTSCPACQAKAYLDALDPPRFRAYDDGGGGAYVQCHNCSSDATHFEPDTGWTCSACGASDADE